MHYESADSPATPGLFAVVRVACGVTTVECDGFEYKRRADQIARAMNEAYALGQKRAMSAAVAPADRPLVKGFYTDKDAE